MIPLNLEWDPESKQWIEGKNTPDAITAKWEDGQWVEGKNPPGPGALRRGFATGLESTKGLIADVIPAMVQGAFGYEEEARKNLEEYKERMKALEAKNLLSRTDYKQIKDLGSFASFAGEALGEALPSIATAVLGGVGVGAGAARLGAGRLLSNQVAKRAAELEGKTVAGEVLTKEAALALATKEASQKAGMVAGAFGGSALLNIPETYQSLAEEGKESLGAAFAVGSLKSTLDALGPIRLLTKTRGTEFSDKLTDVISARLLKNRPGVAGAVGGTLETAALEGLTEGSQQLLDETAKAILADKSIDWDQVINAALRGGIGSAPVGGAVGALGARRKAEEATRLQEETAEALRLQEAQQTQREKETEEALTFPEDYARLKEFGLESNLVGGKAIPAKDIPRDEKGKPLVGSIPPEFAGEDDTTPLVFDRKKRTWRPRTQAEAQASEPAYLDRLVSKLARHYNMNDEEEAALVNLSRGKGDTQVQFENFLAEAVKDPSAVSKIPELSTFAFQFVEPAKAAPLALPAPSGFAYIVPGVGTFDKASGKYYLTPKQADAYIASFLSRPTVDAEGKLIIEGADTRDRTQKLQQLRQLDPETNPNAATIDPNERRRLALNVITGVDIQQVTLPTETRLPTGETVITDETVDRATISGQVGTREGTTRTYENSYQRIVDNISNAEGTLGLNWLKKSAGFKNLQPPSDPNDKEAAKAYAADKALGDSVTANAPKIWQQLVNEGYVTKQGMAFKANPQRTQQVRESQFTRNVETLAQALQAVGKSPLPGTPGAVVPGAPTGRLDLRWLEKTLNRPQGSIPVEEAKKLWAALEDKKLVYRDGMYYRPGQKATPSRRTPPPTPQPAPPTQPTPPAPRRPSPARGKKSTPQVVRPKPQSVSPLGQVPTGLTVPPLDPSGTTTQFKNVDSAKLQSDATALFASPEFQALSPAGKVLALRKFLLARQYETGKEHASVLDTAGKGTVVSSNKSHSVDRPNFPGHDSSTENQIHQHTHPSGSSFSSTDMAFSIFNVGYSSLFVHSIDGSDAVLTVNPNVRNDLDTQIKKWELATAAKIAHSTFRTKLEPWLALTLPAKYASPQNIFKLGSILANLGMARTGLFTYADTSNKDILRSVPWESFIESLLPKVLATSGLKSRISLGSQILSPSTVAEIAKNGKSYATNYYRGSESLLQPGGIEKILGLGGHVTTAAESGGAAGSQGIAPTSQEDRKYPQSERDISVTESSKADDLINALTQTSRRGFLRGAGSAAMSAGLPGTQAIKDVADIGKKVQNFNDTVKKLEDLFVRPDMGGLWKIPEQLQEPSAAFQGQTYLGSTEEGEAGNSWVDSTLQDPKKVATLEKTITNVNEDFNDLHSVVSRIPEVEKAADSLFELSDAYGAAKEEYNQDLADKADELRNSILPGVHIRGTSAGKKISKVHYGTLKVLFRNSGYNRALEEDTLNQQIIAGTAPREILEGRDSYPPLEKFFGDKDTYEDVVADKELALPNFQTWVNVQSAALAQESAKRRGLDTTRNVAAGWDAVTPENIINRIQQKLPTLDKDPKLKKSAERFLQEANELRNLTAEDIQELDSAIIKINEEYVKALPKAMSALQQFARLHEFNTTTVPQAQAVFDKIQKVYDKYEARNNLEKRKDTRRVKEKYDVPSQTKPRLTTLADTIFREVSLPQGTPQQMQRQVAGMFDRMQRLEKAADDSVSEDYSCG